MHWLRGLRGREHLNACVQTERHQGVFVEHDRFWDGPAAEHAERRPHDHDAELRFRYSMYQSMMRAETHERIDPPKRAEFAIVHRRRYAFETGRWEQFARETQRRVRTRVRQRLVSRGVPEGQREEMTEELTQDSWTRACSSIGSFDPRVGTLDWWMDGVVSKTVSLALSKEKSNLDDLSGEAPVLIDRCERGLDERAVRIASNEEFEREVLPLLRSRTRRLVQKVLDEEPLRGSDSQTWERNLAQMQRQCESRGWTP